MYTNLYNVTLFSSVNVFLYRNVYNKVKSGYLLVAKVTYITAEGQSVMQIKSTFTNIMPELNHTGL